jgi:hypothetical protein
MKLNITNTVHIACISLIPILGSGCASLLSKGPPSVVATPTPSSVTVTNVVTQYLSTTNPTGAITTSPYYATNVVTTWATNVVYRTNDTYIVNPLVQHTLDMGQSLSGTLPGYGWILSGILAVASGVLGSVARSKSNQASTLQSVVQATVAGVEVAGDAATKASIQSHAVGAGVNDTLDAIVQAVTGNLDTTPVASVNKDLTV